MTATPETTIREIVASDYRTAAIFQRHGLDFCCRGFRTVEQGCRDAGADEAALLRDLDAVLTTPASGVPRFASWDARTLITYIVGNHHAYVRETLPALLRHTAKVASVHGGRHPDLVHIATLFARVADEMTDHMAKEERVLFPLIAALEASAEGEDRSPQAPAVAVESPIRMMEADHRFVGDAMAEIRHLTGNYIPPSHACATWRVAFQELEAFERDLHDHVHLENNVLFPKAVALEAGRRS